MLDLKTANGIQMAYAILLKCFNLKKNYFKVFQRVDVQNAKLLVSLAIFLAIGFNF